MPQPDTVIVDSVGNPLEEDSILISNSELETFQKCEMRAFFAHGRKLQPKDLGEALGRGIFGHGIFERYWKNRLSGMNHADARMDMFVYLQKEQERISDPKITDVHRQIVASINWFNEMGYIPIEIENTQKFLIDGTNLVFCMTPDAVLQGTRTGHDKGELVVVDYKFTGQFWSPAKLRLYQQIPKYSKFLKKYRNLPIARGILMQLNTRQNAASDSLLFLPKWIDPVPAKEERIWRENLQLMYRYAILKELPVKVWGEKAVRTLNVEMCKYCPFANDICPIAFEGEPILQGVLHKYKENDYGYSL